MSERREHGEVINAEWVANIDPGARCDRSIRTGAETGESACGAGIVIGAQAWIETHESEAPTQRHRAYAVVTCETCRLLEIAHEWADAGDVPPFAIARGNRRGLAGVHPLSQDQYDRAARAAERLLDERTKPGAAPSVPAPPAGHTAPDALVSRESRKTRKTTENRRALAG